MENSIVNALLEPPLALSPNTEIQPFLLTLARERLPGGDGNLGMNCGHHPSTETTGKDQERK